MKTSHRTTAALAISTKKKHFIYVRFVINKANCNVLYYKEGHSWKYTWNTATQDSLVKGERERTFWIISSLLVSILKNIVAKILIILLSIWSQMSHWTRFSSRQLIRSQYWKYKKTRFNMKSALSRNIW